jgi:hypothetical protein
MPKTSGYWYKPPGGAWQFFTQTRDDSFDPLKADWLPMDGPTCLAFVPHEEMSIQTIRRVYRLQRRFFGVLTWYEKLWRWLRKGVRRKSRTELRGYWPMDEVYSVTSDGAGEGEGDKAQGRNHISLCSLSIL